MLRGPPESAAATFSLSMCVTARDCATAPLENIEIIATDVNVPITPHMRFMSTSIERWIYTDLSYGHSPAACARHKYAVAPAQMTTQQDAMYFLPLVVMIKIQPAIATMLGSG